jgi:hypothetical protein
MLAEVLEAAARRARELDAEASAELREWTDQTRSPLGRRRHCALVRRRVGAGDAGAAILGRRFLLAPNALDEELAVLTTRPKAPKIESTGDRLRARLGLVGGV